MTKSKRPIIAAAAPRPVVRLDLTADAKSVSELFNPVTGHVARVLARIANPGDTAEIEFTLPRRSAGAPWHVHTRITETFRVVSGQLAMEVGQRGRVMVLGAGEAVTIAPGTPHGFSNASDADVVFCCTVTPGLAFENFIRALYGLAADGRTDGAGMPMNFWQTVMILQLGDVFVPGMPMALQQRLIRGLAWVARRCGAERALAPYLNEPEIR